MVFISNKGGSAFSRKVIADLLNLTEKDIKQLTDDGIIQECTPKHYRIAPTIKSYVSYLQNQLYKKSPTTDYNSEKAKLIKAKREKQEIEVQILKNEVHKAETITFIITNMLIAFKMKMTTLPYKVLPTLLKTDDKDEFIKILSLEISNALKELSEYNPDELFIKSDEDEDD